MSSSTGSPPPTKTLAQGPGRALKKSTRLRWSPGVSVATLPVSSSTGSPQKPSAGARARLEEVDQVALVARRQRGHHARVQQHRVLPPSQKPSAGARARLEEVDQVALVARRQRGHHARVQQHQVPPPPKTLARGPGRALKKLTRVRWSPGVSVATMPVSSSTRCGAGGSRKKCATRPQALLGSVTRTRMLPARARAAGLAP